MYLWVIINVTNYIGPFKAHESSCFFYTVIMQFFIFPKNSLPPPPPPPGKTDPPIIHSPLKNQLFLTLCNKFFQL